MSGVAFLSSHEQFRAIAERFVDTDQDMARQLAALERIAQEP